MPRRPASIGAIAAVMTIASLAGLWSAAIGQEGAPGGAPAELAQEDRYLVHPRTDRPSYRPGEVVRAHGPLLHALTRRPHPRGCAAKVEVRSPRGDVVATDWPPIERAGLAWTWTVPPGAAGGVYRLVVSPQPGYPPAEATFEVRAYRAPRLNTDLQFVRKAYGPGDEVEATLAVTRAEGGAPGGAAIVATARVDGREVARVPGTLDARGRALVRFRLPARIDAPDATLAVAIADGGVQETAAKTIPIVLARLRVALHPEGGDLVAGLPTRVYLEARTLTDDPADLRGRIVDQDGRVAAAVATEHEGRGRVALRPEAGRRYRLVVDEPPGVTEAFDLPAVRASGVALTALDDAVAVGAPLRLRVAASEPQEGVVVVALRDRTVARVPVSLGAGVDVVVPLPVWAAGALRVTLHDGSNAPRAERLVLRRAPDDLRLEVTASPDAASPRQQVTVTVRARDGQGRPVDAFVSLVAVDDSTLERQDRRERAPRLPAQVLLGHEVRELRDAHVYLDDHERGARATDLLLGTQGWRRFAFAGEDAFAAAHGDAARRVLARKGPPLAHPRDEFDGALAMGAGGGPVRRPAGARNGPPPEAQAERARAQDDDAPPPPAPSPARPAEAEPAREEARQAAAEPLAKPGVPPRDARMDDERGLEEPFARARRAPPAPRPWVRVYAHAAAADAGRADFAETLLWSAGQATGPTGELTATFALSDAITTFRVRADAVGRDGALAWADATVTSRRPLYAEVKLPLEVTAGDRPLVPVALVSGAPGALEAGLALELGPGLALAGDPRRAFTLAPGARVRALVPLEVGEVAGEVAVGVRAQAGPHRDDVARMLRVVPRGFPIERAAGGRLETGADVALEVALPERLAPGSLAVEATVYPSPLASLAEAVAALVREPSGCFEQTSSSHYPNVMAMRYMRSHSGVDPALVARTAGLLERGYAKLVSFECKERGYEWFGGSPGHEALTAYGLLEFSDMQPVAAVDPQMLERTRRWLLSRRDGQGGFQRNPRALDSFGGAPAATTNGYITWALVEAGERDVAAEVEALVAHAQASEDSYLLALAANVAWRRDLGAAARGLMDKLVAAQVTKGDDAGAVDGAVTSITRSGGESLRIETTALAALAWLHSPAHTAPLEAAMRWLLGRCKGGRFGSTQATVLALRAVVAYDALKTADQGPRTVECLVDGEPVARFEVPGGAQEAVRAPDLARHLRPGRHELTLRLVDGGPLPASLVVRYRSDRPVSSTTCPLALEARLAQAEVTEGEATELTVRLTSRSGEGLPMTVAIVGVPAGLEVRTDRLEELKRAGAFDFVETRGRDVVLYWRALPPEATKEVVLSLVAQIPGTYTGPASRTYLYYTDEEKVWTAPLVATIRPRDGGVQGR